jgi:hypothetical protein
MDFGLKATDFLEAEARTAYPDLHNAARYHAPRDREQGIIDPLLRSSSMRSLLLAGVRSTLRV